LPLPGYIQAFSVKFSFYNKGALTDACQGIRLLASATFLEEESMTFLLFVGGLVALIFGAELLVRGASRLAITAGISPLVVGLTVVAFGTSSPEVAVSVGAALEGNTDIAVGNVVGSNIFNVLFILGISALIAPLIVHAQIIRQEVPIMVGASVLLLAMIWDGSLSRVDAGILLALLMAYTVFLVVQSRKQTKATQEEYSAEAPKGTWDKHWAVQVLMVLAGLALLVLGSDWLVGAATTFAKAMGVSDLVIALTIVAAGTSMPEVATSITAAIKGERDIAVGNVIGSNTFNILGCLGASGLVSASGLAIAPSILSFDIWVMLVVALACIPIFLTGREIARWEGFVFLGYYVAYTAYLVLASQQHDALPMFSQVMMLFVVPLTVITLAVAMMKTKNRPV
jgi:cation:H+ antiporter